MLATYDKTLNRNQNINNYQGWARGVTGRDRAETETLASPPETRPRQYVCRSRDATETLKCTLSLMQY